MGNSKSVNLKTYHSKPTDTQMKHAIGTLRAYRMHVSPNDKYHNAIGKFLNEIDQITKNDHYSPVPPLQSNQYNKKKNRKKKRRHYSPTVPVQNRNNSGMEIGNWLRQNAIYDSNVEYMLKLQHIKYSKNLATYTQSQWDELYTYCTVKCCKNRAQHFMTTMQNKMEKLFQVIDQQTQQTIQLNASGAATKQKKVKNITRKRKKHNKRRKIKSNKKQSMTVQASKSSESKPFEDNLLSEQNKQFSYKEILVHGYIRNIGEQLLSHVIIPIDICHLCLKYFSHNEIFLLHIPIQTCTPICIKVRNNFYSSHKMSILELNTNVNKKQNSTQLTDDKWRIQNSSLCLEQNIKLPAVVTTKLNFAYNRYYKCYDKDYYKHFSTDTYSIIFNRGGGHVSDTRAVWEKKCYAISFNDRELYKSDTSRIVGFKYSLPTCKRELSSLLYSERYGLIAVGGGISIYNLSFRNKEFYAQNKKEWKWLSFGHLQERRKQFSTVMLDAKRLMVVGGDKANEPKSELIDLSGHRNKRTVVTECNGARCKTGIFYDNYNKRVFVGGGHSMKTKAVDEFYDVAKDKWCIYAQGIVSDWRHNDGGRYNTDNYENWPILYSTDKEVMYITCGSGHIRYTDLRENTQQWKVYQPNIKLKGVLNNRSYRVVS